MERLQILPARSGGRGTAVGGGGEPPIAAQHPSTMLRMVPLPSKLGRISL